MTTLAEALGLKPADETKPLDAADEELLRELDGLVEESTSPHEFFKKVLESKAYRRSVMMRILTGTLPHAIECRIVDKVVANPVERVEFEDKTKDVSNLSLEELNERHQRVAVAMQKILQARSEQQH